MRPVVYYDSPDVRVWAVNGTIMLSVRDHTMMDEIHAELDIKAAYEIANALARAGLEESGDV